MREIITYYIDWDQPQKLLWLALYANKNLVQKVADNNKIKDKLVENLRHGRA